MINKPRLSICIPTFNRLNYLKDGLNAIMQSPSLERIEICISDNHSTDGTREYIENLKRQDGVNLRYKSQLKNIGIDGNMLSAIDMAKGDYIYPLGDDDFLPVGSIEAILKEIEEKTDLLILNGWHTDAWLMPLRKHLSVNLTCQVINKPELGFQLFWDKMPFGSFLASRHCFSSCYFHKFAGTSHAYAGAVWEALCEINESRGSCTIKSMRLPTVLLRGAEKTWKKDADLILLYEIPLWFKLIAEKNIYNKVAESLCVNYINSQTKFRSLLNFRLNGLLNSNNIIKLTLACNKWQKFKIRLIAKCPVLILKQLYKIKNILKNIYRGIRNACR